MNNRYVGHFVVFLVATLFVYIFSISPSLTKAKAFVTNHTINSGGMQVTIKVCPSFWFDDNNRENRQLADLFRHTLNIFIHSPSVANAGIPAFAWRVQGITLDSETMLKEDYRSDGRCRDITTTLNSSQNDTNIDKDGYSPTQLLFNDHRLLRIGVRDKQGFISQYDNKTKQWQGAAIDFGQIIAKNVGKTAVFSRLRSLESRFFALRYGVVDASISLISYSPKRKELAYLSDPYYSTGLVMGTFLPGVGELHRTKKELNTNRQTMVAVQGSSGMAYLKRTFPKINVLSTTTSQEIPSFIEELMADQTRGEVFFVTDELIARRWSKTRLVYVDKQRFLTNKDSYVVAIANEQLLSVVNQIISRGEVEPLYKATGKIVANSAQHNFTTANSINNQ